MSIQISYKKQFVLGVLFLLCIIGTLEVASRIYEFFNPYCSIIDKDAMNQIDWYTVRWICIDTNLLDFEWPDIQRYVPDQHLNTININSHGFRSDEFTREKLDNDYRIFVVGGSSTFGYGASSNEKTIPGQLDKIFKNKNVEIINAGIGGATSFEEKYLIENDILQLDPDMIIIFDGGNDVRYEQVGLKNYSDVQIKNPYKFKNYKFYRTPFVIWETFLRFNHDGVKSVEINESMNNKISTNWGNNMRDICKIGIENNIRIAIFIQPLLGSEKPLSEDESKMFNDDKKELSRNIKRLNNLIELSHNLKSDCPEVYDLTNIFKNTSESIFFDDIHLNEKGNYMIAEKIYEKILPIILKDISK